MSRGGNDVANAVAPLLSLEEFQMTIDLGFITVSTVLIPLLVGGVGMALGLIVIGRKVVKTLANEVVSLSPSSALSASISVFVVMFVGTLWGFPLSGTHVLVAALIAVGWVANKPIQMKQVKEILISWIITIPIAGGLAVGVLWVLDLVATALV
jgi:phosphate/sulfate permease